MIPVVWLLYLYFGFGRYAFYDTDFIGGLTYTN